MVSGQIGTPGVPVIVLAEPVYEPRQEAVQILHQGGVERIAKGDI